MTSTSSSNFSHYHPAWESRDFSAEEYKNLLKQLAEKSPDSVYVVDQGSILVSNRIMSLWQRVKGWCGFENNTDPVKVNYEFLKLLRYGETHHFFNNTEISSLVNKLKETLDKERPYKKIAEVIQSIQANTPLSKASPYLDSAISSYYIDHQTKLKDAFWPGLFHKYVAPMVQTALPGVHYNMGRIYAVEGHYAKALHSLTEALKQDPDNTDWHLTYASVALDHALELTSIDSMMLAVDACKKAMQSLQHLQSAGYDVTKPEYRDLKMRAQAALSALYVKDESPHLALSLFDEETSQMSFGDVEDAFEKLMETETVYQPDPKDLSAFYLLLSEKAPEDRKTLLLEKAVEQARTTVPAEPKQLIICLNRLAKQLENTPRAKEALDLVQEAFLLAEGKDQKSEIAERLVLLRTKLAKIAFREGNYPSMLDHYSLAAQVSGAHHEEIAKEILDAADSLFETDKQAAIKIYEQALPLLEHQAADKEQMTNVYLRLAADARDQRKKQEALDYLKRARALNPIKPKVVDAAKRGETVVVQKRTQLDENQTSRLASLAALEFENQDFENALKHYQQAQEESSSDQFKKEIYDCLIGLADQFKEETPSAHRHEIGKSLLDSGDSLFKTDEKAAIEIYKKALPLLNELVDKEQITQVYLRLSAHAKEQKNEMQAIKYLQKINILNPGNPAVLHELIQSFIAVGNRSEAKAVYRELLQLGKATSEQYASLAVLEFEDKEFEQALTHYKQARERSTPGQFKKEIYECLIKLGDRLENSSHPDDAFPLYKEALSLASPDQKKQLAERLILLGAKLEAKNFPKAIEAYRLAVPFVERQESIVQVYRALSLAAKKGGHLEEALQFYQKAKAHSQEKNAFAEEIYGIYSALAANDLEKGNIPRMIEYYRLALEESRAHQKEIAANLVAAADSLFKTNDRAAYAVYQEALQQVSPDQKGQIAGRLILLGAKLERQDLPTATKAYQAAIPFAEQIAGEPQAIVQAYLVLSTVAKEEGRLNDALDYYRKAAALSQEKPAFAEEICEVYCALADQALKSGDYHGMLEHYRLSLKASSAHRNEIGKKLNQAADSIFESDKQAAIPIYEEALSLINEQAMEPKKMTQMYLRLSAHAKELRKDKQAIDYLQRAKAINPREQKVLLELASLFDATGDEKQAISHYEEALRIAPLSWEEHSQTASRLSALYRKIASNEANTHDQYLQKAEDLENILQRVSTEAHLGHQYYAKGTYDPKTLRQTISDAVKYFREEAPYRQELLTALGAWSSVMGESREQKLLRQLGQKTSIAPHELEADGQRLIQLLETAYDGKKPHLRREDMPKDLNDRMTALRNQLQNLQAYHRQIHEQTLAAIEAARGANVELSPGLLDLPSLEDLSQAHQLTVNAREVLHQLQRISPPTPGIREHIKSLSQALSPSAWMYQAIDHYSKVSEIIPGQYGEHCNLLIDAHIQAGEYLDAILLYEKLKAKFPTAPLRIDRTAYPHVLQNPNLRRELSEAQMHAGLIDAANQYESHRQYEKALENYQAAMMFAPRSRASPAIAKLVDLGDKLRGTDLSLQAYEIASPHLGLLDLRPERRAQIYKVLAKKSKGSGDIEMAISYLSEALKLVPNNPELIVDLADAYEAKHEFEFALREVKQAFQLQPENASYKAKIGKLSSEVGHQYYAYSFLQSTSTCLKETLHLVTASSEVGRFKKALDDSKIFGLGGSNYYQILSSLGKSTTPNGVQQGVREAIQIIELAYDGKGRHLKPEEMGPEVRLKLQQLKKLLAKMQEAYLHLPLMASLAEARPSAADAMHHAMEHYARASELTEGYGIFCNRLIDTHVQLRNYPQAIETFETFKSQFEGSPLTIDPEAYIAMAKEYVAKRDWVNAVGTLKKAIEYFPDEPLYKKALSHTYFVIADLLSIANQTPKALKYFDLALSCGVEAEADLYAKLADLYEASWKGLKDLETRAPLRGNARDAYLVKTGEYRKKAADLAPDNAAYQYAFGLFGYHHAVDLNLDAITPLYFKKATVLEPTNVNYAKGLLNSLIRRYREYEASPHEIPEIRDATIHLKSLGATLAEPWEDGERV